MKQYLDLLQHILDNGVHKEDRTCTGTISTFGYQMRFDLSKGFPLITTKKTHLKSIIYELLWFLKGDTNIQYLNDNGVKIWNPDAYRWFKQKNPNTNYTFEKFIDNLNEGTLNEYWGNLGPIYGKQWRSWDIGDKWPHSIDQISDVIEQIKTNPNSRRLIVSAWNVGEIDDMALPPCHCLFQFYVSKGKLSCQLYQRSADTFLGVPFNIASYALLTMMIANVCGLEYGEFIHTFGDVHIYNNHLEQVKLQLSREPKPLPHMLIQKRDSIFDFQYEDFNLVGYDSWPAIKGEVSV